LKFSVKKYNEHYFLHTGGSRSSLQETCEDQSSLPSSPRRLNKSFKEKDLRATAVTKGNNNSWGQFHQHSPMPADSKSIKIQSSFHYIFGICARKNDGEIDPRSQRH